LRLRTLLHSVSGRALLGLLLVLLSAFGPCGTFGSRVIFCLYSTRLLFDLVSDEGHFMRADPLRHQLIFYHGHTAAFYMNKLISARVLKNTDRIDAEIESLVAIGVDEMSW
jgi:hypothetical protein